MTTKVGDVRLGHRTGTHWRVVEIRNGYVYVVDDHYVSSPGRPIPRNQFGIDVFETWVLVRRGEPNLSKFALWQRKVA